MSLSEDAYTGLQQWCLDHDVPMSSVVEAIGRQLAAGDPKVDKALASLLPVARAVAAERSSRPRRKR